MLVLGVDEVLVLVLRIICVELWRRVMKVSTHLHAERVYGMIGEGDLPLVHASEAGKLDGLPAVG